MQVFLNAVEIGLILAVMSMGIFITFKILNLPDLTIDASYTLGAAVAAVFTVKGHPLTGILLALVAGALAGMFTGFLHTKLNFNPILAGILTMTGLYSVNFRIMDQKPVISIFGKKNLYSFFEGIFPEEWTFLIVNGLLVLVVAVILFCFLKTQLGISMIATGDNEEMVRASSINSNAMKIMGLAIGNALVALAGAVMVSYVSLADISGGIGMMVTGIASILVGLTLLGESSLGISFAGVVVGSVVYRYILGLALSVGIQPGDLKLLSTILVIVAVGAPTIRRRLKGGQ